VRRVAAAAALAAGGWPGGAAGHAALPGAEGLLAGAAHPFSSPGQVLALLALGLMGGLASAEGLSRILGAFAAAAALGLALGLWSGGPPVWAEAGLLAAAALAGGLAALAPGAAAQGRGLAGAGGLLLGAMAAPDPGPLPDMTFTAAGALTAAGLAVVYAGGGAGWLRRRAGGPWATLGLRVAASWVAAAAVLMLALSLSAPGAG
jgi:hypothetical protein